MNWSAVDFIKSFEGCRLQSYKDQGGVWTIGWGSTGPSIVEGLVWTQDQADRDLATRVQKLEDQFHLYVTRNSLSQDQVTALTDFAYNLGFGALIGSTLLKYIESGNDLTAAKAFCSWDHIGVTENKGLLIRRLSEALLYLKGSI